MNEITASLWTEESSDADLIAGVRSGEASAYGVLFQRHGTAARRVASCYSTSACDIDDIVSDAFERVLTALKDGKGPEHHFRAYLFTVVRRTGLDSIRRAKRVRPHDDMATHEEALGYLKASDAPGLADFESSVVTDAFRSLPERWQAVLWYTEIENKSPAEVAPLLGLSANGVAALAYRAREALRQAYLQSHLATATDSACLTVIDDLGAYVRGELAKRPRAKLQAHLLHCPTCHRLVAELEDVNGGLRSAR